ncbi:hypothetical protein ACFL6N_01515 [Thermodesulfobacteriota bacterium]
MKHIKLDIFTKLFPTLSKETISTVIRENQGTSECVFRLMDEERALARDNRLYSGHNSEDN